MADAAELLSPGILTDIVDDEWTKETLPKDGVPLPSGMAPRIDDAGDSTVSTKMSTTNVGGSSAVWDRNATNIFSDLCLKEIELGNRPSHCFSKEGWQNIMTKFNELTGKNYCRMKFKNKWDQLKRDWKTWKDLKRGCTGLGWDPSLRTIAAPDAWWAEKLQVVPAAKKFKANGIDPKLEEKLDIMFHGVVATGSHAFTPSQHDFFDTPDDRETEHLSDFGGRPSHTHIDLESTGASKRQKVQKKNMGTAFIRGTIEKLVDSMPTKSAVSEEFAIQESLELLETHDEIKMDRKLYIDCVKLLLDPMRRDIFRNMPAKDRLNFLFSLM